MSNVLVRTVMNVSHSGFTKIRYYKDLQILLKIFSKDKFTIILLFLLLKKMDYTFSNHDRCLIKGKRIVYHNVNRRGTLQSFRCNKYNRPLHIRLHTTEVYL